MVAVSCTTQKSAPFNDAVSCEDYIVLVVDEGDVSQEKWWNCIDRGKQK
jgi:hypothetical protein